MIALSKYFISLIIILILNACSTTPPIKRQAQISSGNVYKSCLRFYDEVDTISQELKIQDAQSVAIYGYPYLHSNRVLASYAPRITPETKSFWLTQLQKLGLQSLSIIIENLPSDTHDSLLQKWRPSIDAQSNALVDLLQSCSENLHVNTLYDDETWQYLIQHSKVPDHYASWKRVVGLYPIVSMFMAMGINKWHKDSTAELSQGPELISDKSRLVRYTASQNTKKLVDRKAAQAVLSSSSQNPLQIPLPSSSDLEILFATYAPTWEIDTQSDNDKLGAIYWPADGDLPAVNIDQPTMYQLTSHVHFYGKTLLQLNYVVWMPQRPCTSGFDFLCGKFDGLIWRVTLKENGEPLLYDSIHNCGCYHTFFPVDELKPLPPKMNLDETAFVPVKAPKFRWNQSLTIRLSSVSHYLDSVYYPDETKAETIRYVIKPYNDLRSLPTNNNGRKSFFQANGIVAGTERKERWIFWPMGIASPGAMRQWGTHATAFVGRRHFDDPCILENSFLPMNSATEELSVKNSANYLCIKKEEDISINQ